ncbi:MAG: UDP-N-acetylmuramoyl-tripeptide--D-alanyl-D-alanine ligase [Acidobacteriota bacterium]
MAARVDLTAAMVAECTGGRLAVGEPATTFAAVSIDTRTLAPGALFVALAGERFDGHDFVDRAVDAGAAGLLVARLPAAPRDVAVIVVDDTLAALQALGRAVRRASGARVVAITGSAGKTTTKEITAELIAASGARVHRTRGNLNNHIGLPLTLIEMAPGCDVAVVELGMNHAGEIRRLVEIAEPEIRVWTNVGDAHVGHFGSREAVAEAKAEVLEDASGRATVVANADDPLVMHHVRRSPLRRVTFGESSGADVRAVEVVDHGYDGVEARIETPAGAVDVTLPLPGRVNLSNLLAAVAAASECGVPLDVVPAVAARLTPVARRGTSTTLPGGVRVIDDSYNASPAALEAAIAALAATPSDGRRVLVVGEMLELGDRAADLHESCGAAAARAGVSLIAAIGGPAMDRFVEAARRGGVPPSAIHRFVDSRTAAGAVAGLLRPGDVVLVKGSRGTRTDVVVDHLVAVA